MEGCADVEQEFLIITISTINIVCHIMLNERFYIPLNSARNHTTFEKIYNQVSPSTTSIATDITIEQIKSLARLPSLCLKN